MKKIFYLFVLLLCAKSIYAQEGFVYDNKTLKSEILKNGNTQSIYHLIIILRKGAIQFFTCFIQRVRKVHYQINKGG